ncbi:hypothetical protein A0H81_13014, partial [Grifola frondosa]
YPGDCWAEQYVGSLIVS